METFFQALKKEYWFQRHYGHDHLILAFHWLISPWSPEIGDIVPMKYRKLLENFTSTRFEKYGITEWFNATVADESFRTFHPTSLLRTPWELTRRAIVVPYKERTPVLPNISFSQWKNRESLCHYYTRSKLFAHGGTDLRHLPFRRPELFTGCNFGYGLSKELWLASWRSSKYCFVIRGDTPTSHAFPNSIASGCIPVIISDEIELVGLPFVQYLSVSLDEFAIRFTEAEWLNSTEEVMTTIRNIPDATAESMLHKLNDVRALLLYDHPHSQVASLVLRAMQDSITDTNR